MKFINHIFHDNQQDHSSEITTMLPMNTSEQVSKCRFVNIMQSLSNSNNSKQVNYIKNKQSLWNSINPDIRNQQSLNSFRNAYIKDYFSV